MEDLVGDVGKATIEIWKDEGEKDEERLINAAIRAELRPQAIQQATASVRSALDSVNDSDDPHKKIMDDVRKAARSETTRTMQSLMKSQQKNLWATSKAICQRPKIMVQVEATSQTSVLQHRASSARKNLPSLFSRRTSKSSSLLRQPRHPPK